MLISGATSFYEIILNCWFDNLDHGSIRDVWSLHFVIFAETDQWKDQFPLQLEAYCFLFYKLEFTYQAWLYRCWWNYCLVNGCVLIWSWPHWLWGVLMVWYTYYFDSLHRVFVILIGEVLLVCWEWLWLKIECIYSFFQSIVTCRIDLFFGNGYSCSVWITDLFLLFWVA